MASWADFEAEAADLARTVRRTFEVRKHATMATVRADGSPRISGTEVEFSDDGEIYLGVMPGARRAGDLRRDPRLALHCPTDDPPPGDDAAWLGDGKISGRAVEVEPHRFRIDIDRVVHTKVSDDVRALDITVWAPGDGVRVIRRE